MDKIKPPAEGTGVSETTRNLVDAGISAIPFVGGPLAALFRLLIPSRRDASREKWEGTVSTVLTDTSQRSERAETEIVRLSMEHATLEQQVIGTKVIAEQTALDVGELKRVAGRGVIVDEPLDGELDICRDLVDRRQYHIALEVLKTTFTD